ncbi:hypothetical protein [Zavarzinella formosa]|uniref:hypothetical protein n=1 Tax=Zavarzinella formosa TaxID=360055 RepID=UPI0002EEB645|nr:hypothetical protein [Zavarzinella formosa]
MKIPIPSIPTNYFLIAAAVIGFGAGWTIQGWRWDASEKKAVEAAIEQQAADIEKANAKSSALERELAGQNELNRTLQGRITRETRNPAYRCRVPADGVRILDAARTGKAPGKSDR